MNQEIKTKEIKKGGFLNPLKRFARITTVFIILLFPWWVLIPFPIIIPILMFLCYSHIVIETNRGTSEKPEVVRKIERYGNRLRWLISYNAVCWIAVLWWFVGHTSKAVYFAAIPLILISCIKKFRWIFPIIYFIVIITFLSAIGSGQDEFISRIKNGDLQSWIEPLLVKHLKEPDCGSKDHPAGEEYQIRGIEFEPDESAVYVALLTDETRDAQLMPAVTVVKIAMESDVEDKCWIAPMSLYAQLDAETRRLFIGEYKTNFIRVIDADKFTLMDSWKVKREYDEGGFSLQELMILKEKKLLLALSEGGAINGYNLDSGELEFGFAMGMHSDFAYDPETHILYTANYLSPLVTGIDIDTQKEVSHSNFGIASWGVSYHPESKHVYATDFFKGRVFELRKDTLEETWSKYLGPGIRPVLADEERGVIFVGDYISGYLYIISMKNRDIYSVYHLGTGIYQIAKSPVSGRIFLGTKSGLFILDMDKMTDNPFKLKTRIH